MAARLNILEAGLFFALRVKIKYVIGDRGFLVAAYIV